MVSTKLFKGPYYYFDFLITVNRLFADGKDIIYYRDGPRMLRQCFVWPLYCKFLEENGK